MNPTLDPAVRGRELIAFRVGAQEFAIAVSGVREIRGWALATPLPHAPAFVRGVINLRGTVLPIVDLASRLGFADADATARHVIIVAEIAGQLVGLLVEAVSDILTVPDEAVQPTPEVGAETARSFLDGIVTVEGRMVSLLSLDRILPPPALDDAA